MEKLAISEKYMLTIQEASAYFNIGDKKLRKLIDENIGAEYIMTNGRKYLIKKKLFEKFLELVHDDPFRIFYADGGEVRRHNAIPPGRMPVTSHAIFLRRLLPPPRHR